MLIEAAEKWLKEYGVEHIVITSQDRAAGFYEKLGYKLNRTLTCRYTTTMHRRKTKSRKS